MIQRESNNYFNFCSGSENFYSAISCSAFFLYHRFDYFFNAANPKNFFSTVVNTFGFELNPNGVDISIGK
jgi:hypothetical protein